MRLILLVFIIILVIGINSCSAGHKYKPISFVVLSANDDIADVTYEQIKLNGLKLLPCKNETKQLEVNSIIDSILQKILPEIFPDIFRLNDSLNSDKAFISKSLNSYNYSFHVKIDSVWKKRREGYWSGSWDNRTYNPPKLDVNLNAKLIIVDQVKNRIIWSRKTQTTIYRTISNSLNDSTSLLSPIQLRLLSLQLVNSIKTAINILKLPVNLQIELNEINLSNGYNISIESALKIYRLMGANITKKKFDYKIDFNDRRIYLPLESKLFISQNYNDIIIMLKECNLYYKN